jgi:hypothetical protein
MTGLLLVAMRVLEILFFVGLAGSTVVVLISFVEDLKVLVHRDRPVRRREQTDAQQAPSVALHNPS